MLRTTSMRLLGLALVLVGAGGVVWFTASNGANTMAKADESGKPRSSELRKRLSSLQYHVTQESGTEPPFENQYWNNHDDGIYVDVVSGEPLFSSRDKYDSGTGWPSFTRPLEAANVVSETDDSLGISRVEVRSRHAGSHLGHVFDDGPGPTHQRYCMNSAAMRFIPVDSLEAEGYGRYLPLFGRKPAKVASDDKAAPVAQTKTEVATLAGKRVAGLILESRVHLMGYAVIRFGVESLRGDLRQAVGPFSISQAISLAAFAAGAVFLAVRSRTRA